jgi:hypothetical protein
VTPTCTLHYPFGVIANGHLRLWRGRDSGLFQIDQAVAPIALFAYPKQNGIKGVSEGVITNVLNGTATIGIGTRLFQLGFRN